MPSSVPSSTSRHAFTPLALLLAAFAGTACGAFGSDKGAGDTAPASPGSASPGAADGGETPKAPVVNGTPDPSEITEEFGVFVAPTGKPENNGSHDSPLGTIKDGIDLGKRLGKRVYVCTGTFREALVLADSISIIGGLDCTAGRWKVGAPHTRVEAPSSPAVRAKDITSPTRLEALDILAPTAKEPSGSSIGLLAEHSAGLVIAGSKITAGDAANGVDGVEGIQLVQGPSARGADTVAEALCKAGDTCNFTAIAGAPAGWYERIGGSAGGTSVCAGAPGHDGQSGGNGGSGRLFERSTGAWRYYFASPVLNPPPYAPNPGQGRLGTAGTDGTSGTASATLGTLAAEGYTAANGVAGTDGLPGNGGSGGFGTSLYTVPSPADNSVWHGNSGPGGGAGGCPGLAGTPGTGGGASIAIALLDSPITIDATDLFTGHGGNAGRGTLGSDPTPGGAPGTPRDANAAAKPGGNGGLPGISTNGSNGPSVGVLHSGTAPTVRGTAKITPGRGGDAIDARSKTDALGNTMTIPETPAGISQDILAL